MPRLFRYRLNGRERIGAWFPGTGDMPPFFVAADGSRDWADARECAAFWAPGFAWIGPPAPTPAEASLAAIAAAHAEVGRLADEAIRLADEADRRGREASRRLWHIIDSECAAYLGRCPADAPPDEA